MTRKQYALDESDQKRLALSDAFSGYQALKPPNRVSVSEGAAANLVIKQTGSSGGPWDATETPYMVEPMDALASRRHEAVVFVKPARTGGTAGLLLGWMAHAVCNDPGDMLFIQMSKDKAREFSKTDVDRAIRNSPNVRAMLSPRAVDSNTFDTLFRHGMWLRIAWPTVSNVSGSTYRYVAITDYDRIENSENVDGEGNLFDLAKKRTTTFLSRGMCVVESSPGRLITDPAWTPATPHEGPPTTGIVSLYNRSDRHRWYWQCPDCREHFEAKPGLELFHLPPEEVLLDEVRRADIPSMAEKFGRRIVCPHCGSEIAPKWKQSLNKNGIWLPDNVRITAEREVIGSPMTSTVRGYWLGGVAAAFQSWKSLVEQYLYGLRDYALTGSEEKLKTTTNTDQGLPYMSRHLKEAQSSRRRPADRGEELPRYIVPPETRMLEIAVDVQGGSNSRFVVQVMALGAGRESWLVDRFEIRQSKREGMGQEFAQIDPAAYDEDWDILTEKLLLATWRTPTENLEIRARMVTVDTGGEDGVTERAYAWYRRVRKLGLHHRVTLYKGGTTPSAPIIKESWVGKRTSKNKGDVPLLVCNTNLLSDIVYADLKRDTPGPGYIHFPAPKHPTLNPAGWLPQAFFDELEAEVREANGTWKQIRKRNETFDLLRMIYAGRMRLGIDKIVDWGRVPAWLAPLDKNSEVVAREDRRAAQENAIISDPVISEVHVVRPRVKRPRRHAYAAL